MAFERGILGNIAWSVTKAMTVMSVVAMMDMMIMARTAMETMDMEMVMATMVDMITERNTFAARRKNTSIKSTNVVRSISMVEKFI